MRMMNLFLAIFIISGRANENRGYNRIGRYGETAASEKIVDSNPAGLITPNNDKADGRLDTLKDELDELLRNQLLRKNRASIKKKEIAEIEKIEEIEEKRKLKSSITDWLFSFRCYFKNIMLLTEYCH